MQFTNQISAPPPTSTSRTQRHIETLIPEYAGDNFLKLHGTTLFREPSQTWAFPFGFELCFPETQSLEYITVITQLINFMTSVLLIKNHNVKLKEKLQFYEMAGIRPTAEF